MKVTLVQFSCRLIGEKLWKIKCFWVANTVKRELSCRNHTGRQCSSLLFTVHSFHRVKQPTKLITWEYWSGDVKLCVQKAWTLAQRLNSPLWKCSSSQGALCQAVFGPKIDYCNVTPTLFLWFGSEWLLAVSKNKVCLKGEKISGYCSHPTKCDDGSESCSTAGVPKMFPIVGLITWKVIQLSALNVNRYEACNKTISELHIHPSYNLHIHENPAN
jgi:hypothetical protein